MKKICSFLIVISLVFSNLMFVGADMQSAISVGRNQTTTSYTYTVKSNEKGNLKGIFGVPIKVQSPGEVKVNFSKDDADLYTLLTRVDIITPENPDTNEATRHGSITRGFKDGKTSIDVATPKTVYFYVLGGGMKVNSESKITITVSHKDIIVGKARIKKAKNTKRNKVNLTWTEGDSLANGYQICYARNKNMTKNKKIINVKDYSTSKTIKKLKKKKTYYFCVRAYRLIENKPFYSDWSAIKKVKIKK